MSEQPSSRCNLELLLCVVKDYHQRDMILEGFLELGITGATVIEAHGMAQVLSKDVPIFAGLSTLFPRASSDSHLILSVLDSKKLDQVIRLIEDVCGDFNEPGSGILFTVPISGVRGLAPEIR